jgi:hypothetical protein
MSGGFVKVPNCVADNPDLQGKPLSVYIAMRRDIDREGQAVVSYTTLVKRTGFGRTAIARAIEALAHAGCITIVPAGAQKVAYRFNDDTDNQSQDGTGTSPTTRPVPLQDQSQGGTGTSPTTGLEPVPLRDRFRHTFIRTEEQEQISAASAREASPESSADAADAAETYQAWEQSYGLLTKTIGDALDDLLRTHPPPWVAKAIREAALSGNRGSVKYVESILKRWAVDGLESKRGAHGPSRPNPAAALSRLTRGAGRYAATAAAPTNGGDDPWAAWDAAPS